LRNLAVGLGLSGVARTNTIAVQDCYGTQKRYPTRKVSFIEADLQPVVIADVAGQVARIDPDMVVVDGVFLGDIAKRLIADGRRVIIDMHNVESALQQEVDRAKYGWLAALRFRKRWRYAQAAERQLAEIADRIWMCSARDVALMQRIVGDHILMDVIPNPAPAWCRHAEPHSPPDPWIARALFVGHLGYRPNIEAGKRLLHCIQPAIRAVFPDATLDICGRSPGRLLRRHAAGVPGVTLIGDPADLAPFYARATVALIPLAQGGGTRLKVLEAMAMGVPVVATAKAVEGLDVVPDGTFLLAETDADFVTALQRLTADPQLAGRLIDAGRRFVFEHHGQQTIDLAVRHAIDRRAALDR